MTVTVINELLQTQSQTEHTQKTLTHSLTHTVDTPVGLQSSLTYDTHTLLITL